VFVADCKTIVPWDNYFLPEERQLVFSTLSSGPSSQGLSACAKRERHAAPFCALRHVPVRVGGYAAPPLCLHTLLTPRPIRTAGGAQSCHNISSTSRVVHLVIGRGAPFGPDRQTACLRKPRGRIYPCAGFLFKRLRIVGLRLGAERTLQVDDHRLPC
jgi:hypothetical protein